MDKRTFVLTVLAATLFSLSSNSQTPARPSPHPRVTPVRLMDRADVRITRVELQPGAVRSVHVHDDVRYHLFIPVSGQLELTVGSAKPVGAAPGQAYYMEKGR